MTVEMRTTFSSLQRACMCGRGMKSERMRMLGKSYGFEPERKRLPITDYLTKEDKRAMAG